jgi:hypothetical protein
MRILVTLFGIFLCLLGIVASGRSGFARFLSERSVATNRIQFATDAVSIASSDPEGHFSRGLTLMASGDFESAIEDFEKAVALRPRDYSLWLKLGQVRDFSGDTLGALKAFEESVRHAPYYAQPRWHLGKALLKTERKQAAFVELGRAAHSDPLLLTYVIDLLWSATDGNATEVIRVIQPQTDAENIALAKYFVPRGKMSEALDLLRKAGSAADLDRHQLTVQLIEAGRFRDASDVWRTGNTAENTALVMDGGFERGVISDATGFVWHSLRGSAGVKVILDQNIAQNGSNSVRLDFDGSPDSDAHFLQQLVILEKNTRYQLMFAARGQEISSGGLPLIAVNDAGQTAQMLAVSKPVPAGSSDWQRYTIEFLTTNQTEAAYIVVKRKTCGTGMCPIFGRVWFDDFTLTKLQ